MNEDTASREVAREQEFVDGVYRQMKQSAANAQALAREGHARGKLGHEGGLVERDAMVFQAAKRLASLDAAHEGLVFGRLDLRPEYAPEPRYIGRIGLRDDNFDVMLIDWRAPAAAVFYQATHADPQNVVRRRILRSLGERVLGVEDDLLDTEVETDLPIIGEGALMAQLSRARDRSMHSIVATIQAEQDKAIRAPSKGVVAISGGPGTGKTVVALHRAAFLLYADQRRYETGGVLVVGPSGVFMRYIERVLPSLGETAVALRSLGDVVDGVRATRRDDPRVAEVKGSIRMAEILRRTSRQAVPGAPTEFRYFYRDDVLRLDAAQLAHLRRQLLSGQPRNRAVTRVASTLIDALWKQVRGERARERTKEDFVETLRDDDAFLDFAAAWWPELDAASVLGWLREPEMLARVCEGVLDDEPVRLLAKSWSPDVSVDLSVDDVALLDEMRYLLGDPIVVEDPDSEPLSREDAALRNERHEVSTVSDREYAGPRGWRPPTNRIEDDGYAHVLVDEAQDLTPMQWRMVGRRGRTATWTIVGDPAQSSWPVPEEAATARAEALGDKQVHAFHLSKNYRNSSEIYDYAAAYAERVGLAADLPEAVRSTGVEPEEVRVADLESGVRAVLTELSEAVEGTVGVVVPGARQSEVGRWLASWSEFRDGPSGPPQSPVRDGPGGPPQSPVRDGPGGPPPSPSGRIAVLTGLDTKGLEFDAIVVVEPEEIEQESPTGRSTLYVVLTRATQRMTVVRGG